MTFFAFCAEKSNKLSITEAEELCKEAENFFSEANELRKENPAEAQNLYRKASLRYEKVLQQTELKNSKTYYNLANIYFHQNDIGRAILYYRKAQMHNPNDPKIIQNLQFARAQRIDNFQETEQTKILKTLFFWHYDLSFYLRKTLFFFFFLIFCFAAIIFLHYRPFWLKISLLCALILSLLSGSSIFTTVFNLRSKQYGVILSEKVIPRKGDSESYAESFTEALHAGTEFELLEKRQKWSEIKLPDGQSCWIMNNDFETL